MLVRGKNPDILSEREKSPVLGKVIKEPPTHLADKTGGVADFKASYDQFVIVDGRSARCKILNVNQSQNSKLTICAVPRILTE